MNSINKFRIHLLPTVFQGTDLLLVSWIPFPMNILPWKTECVSIWVHLFCSWLSHCPSATCEKDYLSPTWIVLVSLSVDQKCKDFLTLGYLFYMTPSLTPTPYCLDNTFFTSKSAIKKWKYLLLCSFSKLLCQFKGLCISLQVLKSACWFLLQRSSWDFESDCIEFLYRSTWRFFNETNFPNPWTWRFSPFIYIFNSFQKCLVVFSK